MIIVTGGAGFIGSNLVKRLTDSGTSKIVVVDDLTDGRKIFNLSDCDVVDFWHWEDFLSLIQAGKNLPYEVEAVFHQGACSSTTEWDGRYMMKINFEFTRDLADYCISRRIPLIYASSASVYGSGTDFRVERACERPINAYAFSKLQCDQYIREVLASSSSQIVGLRYFNVYGPREQHKGSMASVVWHFHNQLIEGEEVRVFEGSDGYEAGEQRRDFIHVDDIVEVNLWFYRNSEFSGVFNLGTGRSRSFNAMARAVIDWHGRGQIRYIPFPDHLKGSYQSFTEADMTGLRELGYEAEFIGLEEGVHRYLDALPVVS